jgi:diguanylate cyclase (GGDEF)-like protein
VTLHWSTHQLTEYFGAVSAPADRPGAIQVAEERAAEALDAEVGAVILQGRVAGCVGLGSDTSLEPLLDAVTGAAEVALAGLGSLHAAAAPLTRDRRDWLVVCRFGEPFDGEERHMLLGMAQVLGLALRSLDVLAAERALRKDREREAEDRLRLLETLTVRHRLLETLLGVQRAVSSRQPLQTILDAITSGAAALLGDGAVSLLLADPLAPDSLILASTSGLHGHEDHGRLLRAAAARAMADEATHGDPTADHGPMAEGAETDGATADGATADGATADGATADGATAEGAGTDLVGAAVQVDGRAVGSLVSCVGTGRHPPDDHRERRQTLRAFAQQVSLALSGAQALEAIREAYHDPVTGLPSRALLIDRLERALASGAPVNVLFIDLDRFKAVNDSLGHAAGDELLAAVAGRLRSCLRGEDGAARIGGDEFAVLAEGVSGAGAVSIAERVIEAVAKPFRIFGRDVLIGASVGVARGRAPEVDATTLLGNADLAMYRAKKAGPGRVTVFEPSMQEQALDALSLSSDLQQAIGGGQLELNYQPIVELAGRTPVALEALLRWRHPFRGAVSPGVFIPLAEQTGLVLELGRWALGEALHAAAGWQDHHPDLMVTVNVSGRQIVDPGFAGDVDAALGRAGLLPDRVVLELTETALVSDFERALACVRNLKDLGVRLAMDDFGTGYSSLSHLRRFPVDLLKIDGSFVRSMAGDARDESLVRAVLGLGRSLGIPTVAEGVETADQLAMLRSNGCELGQGFLLGRPMPGPAVSRYLARTLDLTPQA